MMGAARKMATMVLFGLLMITVSAARVSMLSSPTSAEHVGRSSLASITTSSSTPGESTVRIDSVIGCTPKELARDLVIYCREPVNAPMPIEACCKVAVGTVGRPSCYCLVKEEAAFGMSPLFNIRNMEQLLARCGASIYLNKSLKNPCDRSYDDKERAECIASDGTQDRHLQYHQDVSLCCLGTGRCVGWVLGLDGFLATSTGNTNCVFPRDSDGEA